MKLISYPFYESAFDNWEEVLNNPSNVNIKSFTTGTVIINRKGTLNPALARDILDEEIEVPILAHWVHHEDKGDYLLDTGLDASYIEDPYGGLEGSSVDEFKLVSGENIANHIGKHSVNLKMIFLSHLHADHAAGSRELPKGIPHLISKGEYVGYQPDVHGNFLKGLHELYEIDFSNAQDMPPLGLSADLLGDGSIWAVWTPGHTPGHMSFLVNGIDGPVFLTMDAAFIYENLEKGVAPSDYTWDVKKAQESLEKIIEFLKEYPKVRVGAGHEAL